MTKEKYERCINCGKKTCIYLGKDCVHTEIMENRKKHRLNKIYKTAFWVSCIMAGLFIGLFLIPSLITTCTQYTDREKARAEERQAEYDSLILADNEVDLWIEVYSAAVRRGVWHPDKRANDAIIELRKKTGGSND